MTLHTGLTLQTERLWLRGFQADDLPELCALLADPQAMRYSVHGVMTTAASAQFLYRCCEALARDGFAPLAMIEQASGQWVGFCGLSLETFEQMPEVMLGYRLRPAYWNQGLATEAVRAVLIHAFDTLELGSVTAVVEPDNLASVQVLHKVGFRGWLTTMYHGMGVRLYRLNRDKWPSASA
ncbi:GNAT family N-acetyltransferase [Pseudomonas syringae]|nr:GNAT family N-acetyltransferase [Pseudomonas syringae]MBD8789280.1 GNAT family N-acetyltransferase [Pseudomonas syringae]MBD8800276.1 GNAT family N-acetyltransferase [Pseudomonas syringae]MBD8810708.1 GNAT family N-acetyltransferase [Pseudomonas syringae]